MGRLAQERPTPWPARKKSSRERSTNKTKERASSLEPSKNYGGKSKNIKITTPSKPASLKSTMNKSKICSTFSQEFFTVVGIQPTVSSLRI
jgi:hypothetical protein